jgi:hypothetical protein
VVSVLVDFQPHLLTRLRQGIVQQARHRLEAVIRSNQDKNRRGDGLDILSGNIRIGKDFRSGLYSNKTNSPKRFCRAGRKAACCG